jgi:hypothetical protein
MEYQHSAKRRILQSVRDLPVGISWLQSITCTAALQDFDNDHENDDDYYDNDDYIIINIDSSDIRLCWIT